MDATLAEHDRMLEEHGRRFERIENKVAEVGDKFNDYLATGRLATCHAPTATKLVKAELMVEVIKIKKENRVGTIFAAIAAFGSAFIALKGAGIIP